MFFTDVLETSRCIIRSGVQAFRRSGVQAFRRSGVLCRFLYFSHPPSCSIPCFVEFFDRLTAPRGSHASASVRVFRSPYDGV